MNTQDNKQTVEHDAKGLTQGGTIPKQVMGKSPVAPGQPSGGKIVKR